MLLITLEAGRAEVLRQHGLAYAVGVDQHHVQPLLHRVQTGWVGVFRNMTEHSGKSQAYAVGSHVSVCEN